MGVSIEDIKHCLLVMIDCEVCEECDLYGTTGTDHCEKDCVDGALHIINKYQNIQEIVQSKTTRLSYDIGFSQIKKMVEDGIDDK